MGSSDNISDLSILPFNDAGLFALPIRGEKIFSPVPTTVSDTGVTTFAPDANPDDFSIQASLSPFYEYILIRIPGRGFNSNGTPDPNSAAYYQFLINPSMVQVSRTTVDAQSLTKAGWQNGVWGEDFVTITLEGKTPGKYFSMGLTDLYTPYTVSYRNLEALEALVENNGYWFEGEQTFDGPLQSNFSHRQIKMHSDVELMVGEVIWDGMFESLTISEDSDEPFLASFSLTFIAWNERYRAGTPYPSPIGGSVQRGHVPGIYLAYGGATGAETTSIPLTATIPLQPNLPAIDFSPVTPIMNPTTDEFGGGS